MYKEYQITFKNIENDKIKSDAFTTKLRLDQNTRLENAMSWVL